MQGFSGPLFATGSQLDPAAVAAPLFALEKSTSANHEPRESRMPPISLTDEEYQAVRLAANAVPYSERGEFLRLVAAELEAHRRDELGVGLIARVVRELSREPQFRPDVARGPDLAPHQRAGSKPPPQIY
jgi:hypothetical protein